LVGEERVLILFLTVRAAFDRRRGSKMPILPVAPVSRLIREAGAKRVSEGARDALAEVLESYGMEVAEEAVEWANHAKRKTVKAEDIREAVKRVRPPRAPGTD